MILRRSSIEELFINLTGREGSNIEIEGTRYLTFMFSSLGVWIVLLVKNHQDLYSFSLEHMPAMFTLLTKIIPLALLHLPMMMAFTLPFFLWRMSGGKGRYHE